MASPKSSDCIYCGRKVRRVRKGKGEHIIPKALGGALCINCVCLGCNNALSIVDKELVSRSYLKFFAAAALDRAAGNVWWYDKQRDLALEVGVLESHKTSQLWPQIVFEKQRLVFHADQNELKSVGHRRYLETFLRHLRLARNTLPDRDNATRPRWRWEQVQKSPRRGRFPPRVYSRHSYDKLSSKIHFHCKYAPPMDRNKLLYRLDTWNPFKDKLVLECSTGPQDVEVQTSFESGTVLRGFAKIGINLLAHICKTTPVNKDTFPEATSFVRYNDRKGFSEETCGFVVNEDTKKLACLDGTHKFRLQYDKVWRLDCAFFGGAIGATVCLPGLCKERWRRAEITVPICSRDWQIVLSDILVSSKIRVEWSDINAIMPSRPADNVDCAIHIRRF